MEYAIGFVLLLGVLVFIHELGHFLLAKACGVRVETFSIGMGKKILRWQRGETEYTISLLPLGGYVKLTGQDPREEVPPELEHRSYRSKAIWQRALVILAGPIFNAVLAFLVLTGLFLNGVPSLAPTLARILPDSPAAKAGFLPGDRIVEVSDARGVATRIRERSDLEAAVSESVGSALSFRVERALPGSNVTEIATVHYTPELGEERDTVTGVVQRRGVISGAEPQALAPVVYVVDGSWAAARQVATGVYVEELVVNGESRPVSTFEELSAVWSQTAAQKSLKEGRIEIKGRQIVAETSPEGDGKKTDASPEAKPVAYTLAWTSAKDAAPTTLEAAGLRPAELALIEVRADSPASKLGLQPGDLLLTLNGEKIRSFFWFRERIQALASEGATMRISWLRKGATMESDIRPESVSVKDPLTEASRKQFQIGAYFMAVQAPPAVTVVKAEGLGDGIVLGYQKSVALTASMLGSFYHLAKGDISPKVLGGPLLIGKIAGDSFKQGWVPFFRMMAFISLNLFLLNLFPIPVLDGGHLVMLAVEAVRRKPVSIKIIEAWTTVGFFLLMGLVVVVSFNDLSRFGLFKFLNL
jgi:regulator of sigma E protease